MKYALIITLAFVLNSCAFSSFFYFPDEEAVAESATGEDIYIEYDKGKKVHALFFERKDPIASVFILHGNAGNLSGWQSIAEALWEEGYQTFIYDYPGFGNSDGKTKHKEVIPSAQKSFDYFIELDQVKNTKKILLGYSLGGNLSCKIGPDNQENLDAMVIEGLFNNYRDIGISKTKGIMKMGSVLFLGAKFKGEETIKEWTKPLLIIHSTEDQTCPYWMGKEVFDNAGSTQKELWSIDGPHIRGMAKYEEQYLAKIKALVQ